MLLSYAAFEMMDRPNWTPPTLEDLLYCLESAKAEIANPELLVVAATKAQEEETSNAGKSEKDIDMEEDENSDEEGSEAEEVEKDADWTVRLVKELLIPIAARPEQWCRIVLPVAGK